MAVNTPSQNNAEDNLQEPVFGPPVPRQRGRNDETTDMRKVLVKALGNFDDFTTIINNRRRSRRPVFGVSVEPLTPQGPPLGSQALFPAIQKSPDFEVTPTTKTITTEEALQCMQSLVQTPLTALHGDPFRFPSQTPAHDHLTRTTGEKSDSSIRQRTIVVYEKRPVISGDCMTSASLKMLVPKNKTIAKSGGAVERDENRLNSLGLVLSSDESDKEDSKITTMSTVKEQKPPPNQPPKWAAILDDIFGSTDPPIVVEQQKHSDGVPSPDSGYIEGSDTVKCHKSRRKKRSRKVESILDAVGTVQPLLSPVHSFPPLTYLSPPDGHPSLKCLLDLSCLRDVDRHQLLSLPPSSSSTTLAANSRASPTENPIVKHNINKTSTDLDRKSCKKRKPPVVIPTINMHDDKTIDQRTTASNREKSVKTAFSDAKSTNSLVNSKETSVNDTPPFKKHKTGPGKEDKKLFCSLKYMRLAPSQPSKLIYNSDGKPDGDYYQKRARPMKHAADRETDKMRKTLLYLESVVCFIMSVHMNDAKMTDESNTRQPMIKDTYELLRQITNRLTQWTELPINLVNLSSRIGRLSLKIQAVLCYQFYHSRQGTVHRNYGTLSQYSHDRRHKCSPTDSGYGTGGSSVSGLTINGSATTPSPTPSPASSNSGIPAGHVAIPRDIDVMQRQQLGFLHYLMLAHRYWQEAVVGSGYDSDSPFFEHLDYLCGTLCMDSPLDMLSIYLGTATEWLISDYDQTGQQHKSH